MGIRALFDECSVPFWIDVARGLASQHDWVPCYWTGDPGFHDLVKHAFPGVVFHPNLAAIRGLPAPEYHGKQLPALDQSLLHDLSFCQSIALSMMDRMDRNNSFCFHEREQLFKRYVRYWSMVLEDLSPDVVVFPVSPHLVYDYVLYSLCKRNNIPTILFEQTSMDGWIYPEQHFEVGSSHLKQQYQTLLQTYRQEQQTTVPLSQDAEAYLQKLKGEYSSATPFYMKDQFAQKNVIRYFGTQMITHPDTLSDTLRKAWYLYSRDHYIKQRGTPIQDSHMRGLRYLFCKAEGLKKKRALQRHYYSREHPADFTSPYIYFPLHYQPENTTCPLGEAYTDQLLIITMLSRYAPDGWKIYVKEHSSQWHVKLHGECSRTPASYDDMHRLPNVVLVPVSTPNFELIDHAQAVVTVTGTAGWEAVVRGKPALIFGHAWYKFCDGVFYIPTKEACQDALLKIHAGFTVDPMAVRLFLSAVQQVGVNAYVEPSYAKIVDFSPEDNVTRLTHALHTFHTSTSSSHREA
ncbi:MAG: hypothetical protein JXA00_03105 [Candidatus Thermoplasmatota archaeon]|nr:hypothetical protein [Candidatus Thermoplasmatota archaeon]